MPATATAVVKCGGVALLLCLGGVWANSCHRHRDITAGFVATAAVPRGGAARAAALPRRRPGAAAAGRAAGPACCRVGSL